MSSTDSSSSQTGTTSELLKQLGQELQAGTLSGAQQVFGALQSDLQQASTASSGALQAEGSQSTIFVRG